MTELWQLQPTDALNLTLDDVHRVAERVESTVSRRNRWGLAVCAIEIFVFVSMWTAFPDSLRRLGCAWTVIGLLFMSAQLLRRPAVRPSATLGLAACLEFQRQELQRQRDFHRGWWFWSRFVAFVPGPAIFGIGAMRAVPDEAIEIALVGVVYVAIAVWAIPLNLGLARGYQRSLDRLQGV